MKLSEEIKFDLGYYINKRNGKRVYDALNFYKIPIEKLEEQNEYLLNALIEDIKFFENNIFLFQKEFSESYFIRTKNRYKFYKKIIEKIKNKSWEEIK